MEKIVGNSMSVQANIFSDSKIKKVKEDLKKAKLTDALDYIKALEEGISRWEYINKEALKKIEELNNKKEV